MVYIYLSVKRETEIYCKRSSHIDHYFKHTQNCIVLFISAAVASNQSKCPIEVLRKINFEAMGLTNDF